MRTVLGCGVKMKDGDVNFASQLMNLTGIHPVIADIVSKMNGINLQNVDDFLTPKLRKLLPNPQVLKDMTLGVDHLVDAIINKKKIGILGDYDVDGVSSSAMLKIFLEMAGVEVENVIPNRFSDGYGPSIPLFQKIYERGIETIITLDCGTVAFEPIEYANSLGMKVVVVDHHISNIAKPDAVAVINPNQHGDSSGLNYLCAAGVTFLFCVGIYGKLRNNFLKHDINLLNLVPFAMLGSVCDMMKMVGLNRAFYRSGIEILNQAVANFDKLNVAERSVFLGLKTLMQVGGISKIRSTYDIGFILGPMINAGGRLESAMIGLDLLTCKDENLALELANKLKELNLERRDIQDEILQNALSQAEKMVKSNRAVIFEYSVQHEGVIGIVASKIKEIHHKPTIIGSLSYQNEIGVIKASCRSIDGVDIGAVVIKALELGLILKGGGHVGAAGFSCLLSKYDELYAFFEQELGNSVLDAEKNRAIYVAASIIPRQVGKELCTALLQLEPFGIGNEKPYFMIKNLYLVKYLVLKEKHYRVTFRDTTGGNSLWLDMMAFNALGEKIGKFISENINSTVSVICDISLSDYGNGVSIIIKDLILQ